MNSPFQAATDGCYQGSPLRGRGRGIYRPSGSLPLNPLLDLGSPKAPEFANVDSTNHAFTSETLKRLGMNLNDRGGFVSLEQTFRNKTDRRGGLFSVTFSFAIDNSE